MRRRGRYVFVVIPNAMEVLSLCEVAVEAASATPKNCDATAQETPSSALDVDGTTAYNLYGPSGRHFASTEHGSAATNRAVELSEPSDAFRPGLYRIKTSAVHRGHQPRGWGISAWQIAGATRDRHSSWAAVHSKKYWQMVWDIQPSRRTKGAYTIKTFRGQRQPAGWGLAAWNFHGGAGTKSSRVAVHSHSVWQMDWDIRPSQRTKGAFTIKTTGALSKRAKQPAGWGLTAGFGGKRDKASNWLYATAGDDKLMDWELERVPRPSRKPKSPEQSNRSGSAFVFVPSENERDVFTIRNRRLNLCIQPNHAKSGAELRWSSKCSKESEFSFVHGGSCGRVLKSRTSGFCVHVGGKWLVLRKDCSRAALPISLQPVAEKYAVLRNAAACAPARKRIQNAAACKVAALELGFSPHVQQGSWSHIPSGCVAGGNHWQNTYYNAKLTGVKYGSKSHMTLCGTNGSHKQQTVHVWGIGTNSRVYYTTGRMASFQDVGGSLKQVSAGGRGIWGVNRHNSVFFRQRTVGGWQHVRGQRLKWVAVSGASVWGISPSDSVHTWSHSKGDWLTVKGSLKQISVSGKNVWGVTKHDDIYMRTGDKGDWKRIKGKLKQISVSGSSVWGVSKRDRIYQRHFGQNFQLVDSGRSRLKHVAVSGKHVWGVNARNHIYRRVGGAFRPVPGTLQKVAIYSGGIRRVTPLKVSRCWVRMPTGCVRHLSETRTPKTFFVDRHSHTSALCAQRRTAYNRHCGRADSMTVWSIAAPNVAQAAGRRLLGSRKAPPPPKPQPMCRTATGKIGNLLEGAGKFIGHGTKFSIQLSHSHAIGNVTIWTPRDDPGHFKVQVASDASQSQVADCQAHVIPVRRGSKRVVSMCKAAKGSVLIVTYGGKRQPHETICSVHVESAACPNYHVKPTDGPMAKIAGASKFAKQYLEVRFCKQEATTCRAQRITSIVTQGSGASGHYVARYKVSYSHDGDEWSFYSADATAPTLARADELIGNSNADQAEKTFIARPFNAVAVRIHPVAWVGPRMAMRVEVYACLVQFDWSPVTALLHNERRKDKEVSLLRLFTERCSSVIEHSALPFNAWSLGKGGNGNIYQTAPRSIRVANETGTMTAYQRRINAGGGYLEKKVVCMRQSGKKLACCVGKSSRAITSAKWLTQKEQTLLL